MKPSTTPGRERRPVLGIILAVLALQLFSRYVAAPTVDFAQDDWHFCYLTRQWPTMHDIWNATWNHPFRPISSLMQLAFFHFWAGQPASFTYLGMILHSLFLLVAMKLALELTGSRTGMTLCGIVFAVLPNLTETFHWAEINAASYAFAAYLLTVWLWWKFWKTGRLPWLGGATVCYFVGLGSSELGILAPFACLALVERNCRRKASLSLLPFALVLGFYLLWRFTTVLGIRQNLLYPNELFRIEFSFATLRWNLMELVRWWAGEHLFKSILNGLAGFWSLPNRSLRLLVAANLVVTLLLGLWLRKASRTAISLTTWRVPLFGLAWAAATSAPGLISYTAGRFNHLPAFGIALALASVLLRYDMRKWASCFLLLVFLALTANQGTARSWKESTTFQRTLFRHICETRPEWQPKKMVLFDTRSLRQRLTTGLLRPINVNDRAWYYYRNATLFRGFALQAMLMLAGEGSDVPEGILDAEHYAFVDGDDLVWSDKWTEPVRHRIPLSDIYILDVFHAVVPEPAPGGGGIKGDPGRNADWIP